MTPTTLEPTTPASTPRPPKTRAPRTRTRAAAPAVPAVPASDGVAVTQTDLIGAIKEVIIASRPPEKITAANRIAYNPMNPANEKRAWKRPFYQNFEAVDTEDVTVLEYELIPLLKPGLFIKSRKGVPLVEVLIVKRGQQRGIHLRYDNSKKDKGIELMTYAPSLEIMLQKCIAEYKVQQDALAKRRAAGLPDDEDDD